MKLVFYSGGDPNDNNRVDKKLLTLANTENPRMAFIPACHYHSEEDYIDFIDQFHPHGVRQFMKWDIDTQISPVVKNEVFESDIIHLGGGNTFYFLKHLRKLKLLDDLKKWVLKGGVLSGLSAGAIIMTSDIKTAGFPSFDCDDNDENIKNLKAMGLVNFKFFPHYKNSKRYDQELMAYSRKLNEPVYACPDGSGIIINSHEVIFSGKVACFLRGNKFFINK